MILNISISESNEQFMETKEEEKHFHLRMNSTFYEPKNLLNDRNVHRKHVSNSSDARRKNHPSGIFRKLKLSFKINFVGIFLHIGTTVIWRSRLFRISKRWSHFRIIKFRLNISWELLTEKSTTVHPNLAINHSLRLLLFGKDERQQHEGFFSSKILFENYKCFENGKWNVFTNKQNIQNGLQYNAMPCNAMEKKIR